MAQKVWTEYPTMHWTDVQIKANKSRVIDIPSSYINQALVTGTVGEY